MGNPKANVCWVCGMEVGGYAAFDPHQTCGEPECERMALDELRKEQQESEGVQ